MINYLKSENYRLVRKKGLYITTLICFLLIAASAAVLYSMLKIEPEFMYATSSFFYSNVVSSTLLILIVALIFNLTLTGRDASILKQSVSFGISRSTIYWSKLLLTLGYFVMICVVGVLFMIGLGENLFVSEESTVRNFLFACMNMVPMVLSGFFMIHALKMLRVGDVYILVFIILVYVFSGDLLRGLLRSVSGLNELYLYAPSTLLSNNLMEFMELTVSIDYRFWLTGMIISVIFLPIGLRGFAKQNID